MRTWHIGLRVILLLGVGSLASAQTISLTSLAAAVSAEVSQTQSPFLTSTPDRLDFSFSAQSRLAATRTLLIQTSDPQQVISFVAVARTDSGGGWLSVSPRSGTASADGGQILTVRADPAGLAPGVYTGAVDLDAGQQTVVIPVTLTVRKFEKQLVLSQNGVTVDLEQGAPPVTRFFFRVGDEGQTGTTPGPGIRWTARAATTAGGEWLQPTATSGETGESGSFGQGAVVTAIGLAPGVYYGFIEVSAEDAGNSPQRAIVTLNVQPAGTAVSPLVDPSGAVLISEEGSNSTILRFVQIINRSASALTFSSTTRTDDGGQWLTPGDAGQLAAGGVASYAPVVRTQGLKRGVYRGEVILAFSNNSTARIRIALVIIPRSSSLLRTAVKEQGACTPNQTVPVFTDLGGGTPASGQAQAITVQVVDDCGNPVNEGTVVTAFEGAGSQQTPMQNIDGLWSGTWTPPQTAGTTNVTATVTATTEAGVSGSATETVPLEPNPNPPPAVSDNGVVNAASFDGEPLAPGTIVSLFGSALSSATLVSGGLGAPSLPLPVELGNTRVTIADQDLPLLFVREDQVNAILPFELGDRSTETLPLVVQRTDTGALSTAVPVSLSAARPGTFTQTGTGAGPGSILDINFLLVTAGNPVRPGDVIQVFATGLGLTDRQVATAAAAPVTEPFARAAESVRATVAGVEAQVVFAGLSPGFAGLYQINLLIPQGVPAGDAELVIFAAGQPSRTATVAVAP